LISILSDDHVFQGSNSRELVYRDTKPGEVIRLELIAPNATAGPPTIQLTLPATGSTATFCPVAPQAWRHWQPSGLKEVECMWLGSAGIPDEQVALLLQK
jgi:hypothetical protein